MDNNKTTETFTSVGIEDLVEAEKRWEIIIPKSWNYTTVASSTLVSFSEIKSIFHYSVLPNKRVSAY